MKTAAFTPAAKSREAKAAGLVRLDELGTILPKKKAAPKAAEPVAEAELAKAFRRGGLDEDGAKAAARGRGAQPGPAGSLVEAGKSRGFSASKSKAFSKGRGVAEAATDGSGFKATDYAYAPDAEDPSTWRLLLVTKPGDGAQGGYAADLVRAAATAITSADWAAPTTDVPAADLAKVRQTIAGAWVQAGLPVADMPAALTQEALARSFRRIGLSEKAAAVASRSRERSK